MLTVTNVEVAGFRTAIRGMRNPLKSWEKADSTEVIGPKEVSDEQYEEYYREFLEKTSLEALSEEFKSNVLNDVKRSVEKSHLPYNEESPLVPCFFLGENDLDLAQRLIKSGSDHSKFMRQIYVGMDITAPLYWWKEADTYKVATTANSESTMHTLMKEPITLDMFSFDGMAPEGEGKDWVCDLITIVHLCETYRLKYIETKDKAYWRRLVQILPNGWNQMRTWTANYQTLRNIYFARRNHKLKEWRQFCEFIETLPYAKELICYEPEVKND